MIAETPHSALELDGTYLRWIIGMKAAVVPPQETGTGQWLVRAQDGPEHYVETDEELYVAVHAVYKRWCQGKGVDP